MDNALQITEILRVVMGNPWLLLFFTLFALGYFLKEKTGLNNKLIPIVIIVVGIILALMLIQLSIAGGSIGFIMAMIIIGFYESLKNSIQFFKKEE